MRVAVIEDDQSIAKGIAWRLQDRGHAVDLVFDGTQADAFLRDDGNEVIILDITLPGISGLSILRNMRARNDSRPVLLLTARTETVDRVTGLDAGADDYLVKPFEMDELEARLRALGRRAAQAPVSLLSLGTVELDLQSRQVTLQGATADLPRREVALLEALMKSAGRTVSKAQLLEAVYGTGADVEESNIEVHVSRLRKKLAASGVDIRVQRGLGYVISAPGESA